jgi:hypothetical protein
METKYEKHKSIIKKGKMAERKNWFAKNKGMQGAV